MRKNIYLIVDTETTENNHIADFAGVVVNQKGEILDQFACLIAEYFQNEELFYDKNSAAAVWTLAGLKRRRENYEAMLRSGSRVLSSVGAVNAWIACMKQKYSKCNLQLTAYNLAFDMDKAKKSGVDLSGISSFCLWGAALGNITNKRGYKKFVLDNHLFNPTTSKGNATYSTNAENVAHYCKGFYEEEPHEALGDILYFELPILLKVLSIKKWKHNITRYSWNKHQLKDHYTVR